jgi:hypothetical protein
MKALLDYRIFNGQIVDFSFQQKKANNAQKVITKKPRTTEITKIIQK